MSTPRPRPATEIFISVLRRNAGAADVAIFHGSKCTRNFILYPDEADGVAAAKAIAGDGADVFYPLPVETVRLASAASQTQEAL